MLEFSLLVKEEVGHMQKEVIIPDTFPDIRQLKEPERQISNTLKAYYL